MHTSIAIKETFVLHHRYLKISHDVDFTKSMLPACIDNVLAYYGNQQFVTNAIRKIDSPGCYVYNGRKIGLKLHQYQ